MATYDLVFNIAKGKVARYAELPAANDALIAVPLLASGIVSAATMRDYDTLSAILAGATDEATGIPRVTLGSVTVTPDDTNDWIDVDSNDVVFDGSTSSISIAAFVICYDPDTTTGTDADLVPLVIFDLVATTAGGNVTYTFPSGGWYRAS